jgi:CHAT domain-containing protein
VRDAYNLNLKNCRLAVLSACETGVSEIAKGEELLGLIRGFLSAGASCLVLSLWTVEDKSTAEFMKSFYAYLKKDSSVSTSLRLAQCEMLEKYPHPFFWSPFFVVGRW